MATFTRIGVEKIVFRTLCTMKQGTLEKQNFHLIIHIHYLLQKVIPLSTCPIVFFFLEWPLIG